MEEKKLTLLIVDDETEFLVSLERPLKTKYNVLVTNKSTEVIEMLRSSHIDCILQDIQMPELNGLELLKEIKFTYPHIPILIMTGHGDNEDTVKALKYGASSYIKKPIDIYLLLDEIKRVTEVHTGNIGRPARILLVDEDKDFTDKILKILNQHGHDVTAIARGEQALSLLEKQFYDIIFMDIQMPNMKGFEFLEKVKQIQSNIIPIVITRENNQELTIEAIKHHVFDIIKKPFETNDLLSSIKRSICRLEINREVLQKNRELTAKEKLLENLNDEISLQKNYLANAGATFGNLLIITDNNGNIKCLNDKALKLFGYNKDEILNKNISTLLNIHNKNMNMLAQGENNIECEFIKKDLTQGYILYSCNSVKSQNDQECSLVFVGQDITDFKKIESSLEQLSYYDALTKLPNQLYFEVRAKQLLANYTPEQEQIAFLYFDLDSFKDVNLRLGHTIGDELLKEVAKRLQVAFRDEDFVARLDGDKFIACLTKIRESGYAGVIGQRIIAAINRPFFIEKNEISVGLSVGIAIFPDSANDYEQLMKNVDIALYKAKQSGRNQFQYYTRQIDVEYGNRLELQNELRFAIMRNEFKLAYQPIVSLTDQKIVSVEALIRWESKRRGMVSPAEFIPIAESMGLIIPLGEWVIEEAIKQYAQWQALDVNNLKVSINLSAWQLDRGNYLIDLLKNTCLINNVSPKVVQLELTETAIMHNPQQGEQTLQKLSEIGFSIAIDDFGQGFSSLSLLSRLPINILKIDRQFISKLGEDKNESIINSIISLAKTLHIAVVAEGIETELQRDYLAKLGCEFGQGFLFAKPVYPEQLLATLKDK